MSLKRKNPDDSADKKKSSKKRQSGIQIAKVEVSDNIAKFYVAKGLAKKQWIVVKEIPLVEIEHAEKLGNELTVTWKGTNDVFFTKEKTDSFSQLVTQVNEFHEKMIEEQQKTEENNKKEEKAAVRRNELLGVINTSISIIDASFNVLVGLQERHIDWQKLEGYNKNFGEPITFTAQTLPSLNLDVSKINSAIKTQIPKETSNQAFSILKATYEYFSGLGVDDEFKMNHPNTQDAKDEISAYFILNDLLLGKVVGDKDNKEENSQLESILQNLYAETNFKVNTEDLKGAINKIDVDSNRQNVIDRSREIFKQQLKQQLKPKEASLATTEFSLKDKVRTEPIMPPVSSEPHSTSTEPPVVSPVTTEPVAPSELVVTPVSTEPVTTPVITKSIPVSTEPAAEPVVPKVDTEPVKETVAPQVSTEQLSTNTGPVTPPASTEPAVAPPAGTELTESVSKAEVSSESAVKDQKKQNGIQVSKVEVSDNKVKFFTAKGLFKKQWILVKEIPLLEIEHIEKFETS